MLELYEEIEPELKVLVEDVLLNRRADATERLVEHGEKLKVASSRRRGQRERRKRSGATERLRSGLSHALVKRHRHLYIEIDAEEARVKLGRPLLVIEGPLMAGMSCGGRPVRRGQDVPAAGGEVGPRDEEGRGSSDAVHGGREGSRWKQPGEVVKAQGQDRAGDGEGRCARYR